MRCATEGIDPTHNTVTKAYEAYAEASGFHPPLEAELIKGIPHGAGLGGGSADAALLLGWLQAWNPAPLSKADLVTVAAKVGADVPFFLDPRPSMAEGVGEILKPCEPDIGGLWGVLVCPAVRISTAWAYAAWDKNKNTHNLVLTDCFNADKNHRSGLVRPGIIENDFEPVVFAAYPRLAALKGQLLREGACAAGLSGSGSALFGLFRAKDKAASAALALEAESGEEQAVYGPFSL